MQLEYRVRKAELSDLQKIVKLYRVVATRSGGIARQADEVTEMYVQNFIERCHDTGIILTIEDPSNPENPYRRSSHLQAGNKGFFTSFQ